MDCIQASSNSLYEKKYATIQNKINTICVQLMYFEVKYSKELENICKIN